MLHAIGRTDLVLTVLLGVLSLGLVLVALSLRGSARAAARERYRQALEREVAALRRAARAPRS